MGATHTRINALQAAVSRLGGQSATARFLGVSQSAVWKWLNVSRELPPIFVLRVEAATGVSRHDLHPDIYPVEHAVPSNTWNALDNREHVVTFVNGGVSLSDGDTPVRYGTAR